MIPSTAFKRINLDFLLLLILLLFINYPVWDQHFWPKHDTLFNFLLFYAFYNNFFLHHELTHWLPYGSFGMRIDYWQIFCMTPASYFAMLLGWLLRIKNVLLLFKIGVFIAALSFLYGVYALYARFFTDKNLPGYTDIITSTLFLSGIILIYLGILGKYIGWIANQLKNRPDYIIKESSDRFENKIE